MQHFVRIKRYLLHSYANKKWKTVLPQESRETKVVFCWAQPFQAKVVLVNAVDVFQ